MLVQDADTVYIDELLRSSAGAQRRGSARLKSLHHVNSPIDTFHYIMSGSGMG